MRIKDIELANISRYRGELMGMAMLFVVLFHVGLPREDAFFGLRRIGQSVVREDRPEVLGAIRTVAHLVTVEEVD